MKAGNLCCGPAVVFLERKIRSAERLANPTFCAVRHKNQRRSLLQLPLTGWGDLNLPDMSGYEVLRSLRVSKVKTPILILSGLAGMEDKVKGLGFGADDYMTKPFHKDELVARIHAIVRRSKGHAQSVVQTGDLIVKLDAKTAQINGVHVHLTGKEYQMLELLSLRKGTTITKEMFLAQLYGGMDEPEIKIIDVFICKLRKKLGSASNGKNYIETVWGRGYILREPSVDEAKMSA